MRFVHMLHTVAPRTVYARVVQTAHCRSTTSAAPDKAKLYEFKRESTYGSS